MMVGDIVRRKSSAMKGDFNFSSSDKTPMEGKVIYIHPEGRYHIVEFDTRGGKIRECFLGAKD